MKIEIIGDCFSTTGYCLHTRQLANALYKANDKNVRFTTNLVQGWETAVNDDELRMIQNTQESDVSIMIGMPHHWKAYYNRSLVKHFIGFLVWEGSNIPQFWLPELADKKVSQIWTPSTHTREAILNTVMKFGTIDQQNQILPKIRVVPHGVDTEVFKPKLDGNNQPKPFMYVLNKGWRNLQDRGGVQFAIRAYWEEFTLKDNVSLFIKLNPAYGIPDVKKMLEELKPKDKAELPQINISTNNIPQNQMAQLYQMADVFVSPTMAESFNLPCIESMTCGVPVITTSFGGQTDFVNETNGWIVDGEFIQSPELPIYEEVKWLQPSIESLRKAMRNAYENKNEVIAKGQKALQDAQKFKWSDSADKALLCLQELEHK